jgi:hypothetical protein
VLRRALLIGASLLLACGCGGGAHHATAQITRADLAAMTLPESSLGARGADMRRGALSGFFSNAKRAATDLDPRDTRTSLANLGRITGYGVQYQVPGATAQASLQSATGLLVIDSMVELFRSSSDVTRRMQRSVVDLQAFAGKRVKAGAVLLREGTFPVPNLGESANGLTSVFRLQGFLLHYTIVDVHIGRMLASVTIGRADGRDVKADAIALATQLAARVRRLAAGKS